MQGKANCCCLARVQHSVLRPGDCGRLHRGVAQHVVRREGSTRVLGQSRSRSRGENESEDLPVRFGRPALAGAVLVGRWPLSSVLRWWQPERVSPPTTPSVPPALRASGSLALMAGSRPPRGGVNEGLPAVAFALGPSLLLSCRPRRRSLPRCWCSGRQRATRSLSSRRPSDVEVVQTRGSGTEVPFVMAP
jgi:hypothetical protein